MKIEFETSIRRLSWVFFAVYRIPKSLGGIPESAAKIELCNDTLRAISNQYLS